MFLNKSYKSFAYALWLLIFWFYGIPVCLKVCVSVTTGVPCAVFGFFLLLFIFSYSDLFVWFLSYLVLLFFLRLQFVF